MFEYCSAEIAIIAVMPQIRIAVPSSNTAPLLTICAYVVVSSNSSSDDSDMPATDHCHQKLHPCVSALEVSPI